MVVELWNSGLDDIHLGKGLDNLFVESDNTDQARARTTVGAAAATKGKQALNTVFYHEPFTFKELDRDVRDLVVSPFTKKIRDYSMHDGLKVPTNLQPYDRTTNLDDHLTVFMGTMDVHKLPEPAWYRFFHITLSEAARF